MPSVFLSYSRNDLSLVEQLEAQLKNAPDVSVWRDQESLYGGQRWPKALGEAIAAQDFSYFSGHSSLAADLSRVSLYSIHR
jgi:hypothetical protein